MTITLPSEYGYVLLAATSTFFINTYHSVLTSIARRASGQKYPIAYASNEVADKDPKAYAFNCTQRAHANFTENLTPYLGALLIAGLRYPVLAGGLGAVWTLARALYAHGYSKSGPKGREIGSIVASLVDLGLKGMAVYASYQFVQELN
ncbi:hypothetical protein QBC33DRAFT_555976 [Phialemonium atrogriseum]|uniref:Microsomal glutathione S-transferase 3 n=1 Tax=Phialemonium atrogriseum TaxID=1093897 RepID=A0AAJ0C5F2_9PEZI|nr:uncharacterized protein QBC33DRAFT_555976 [Phialemonium atrogriseum]KAK1770498.1 hypothetical protein QBC33DRAFT_555976 [Phialemonium atrogriseum]